MANEHLAAYLNDYLAGFGGGARTLLDHFELHIPTAPKGRFWKKLYGTKTEPHSKH